MTTELTKAAQQAPKIKELVEQLRNIANGVRICGVDDRRFVAGRLDEIADALTQRPAAQTEREAFENAALAKWGPLDFERSEAVPEMYYNQRLDDAWIGFGFAVAWLRASLPTQPAAQATPQADPLNPGWCVGCNPDNCMGCGIGLNKAQATPDQFADASKMVAPVALRSVHLTRDTAGMCVVRINGRVAIRDNGDLIDHTATLEWFADTQQATPEPVGDVRCEGCGYMTHHREHMGCVRAAKQHTRPAPVETEPLGEVFQFHPMPEGWPARFRCDSCDGNGEIGELVSMGHFQPPERQTCPDCGGRGWTSEEHAFNADHMREFAEAHALLTRPAPGVPDVEDLRDRLVAISAAVADSDDRAAQSMLGEILRTLAAAQAKE